MRILLSVVAIVLLFILQLALGNSFGQAPDLVLVYLAVILLFLRLHQVLGLGIFVGVLLDYFSGLPDGLMIVSVIGGIGLAFYLAQLFSQNKISDFIVVLNTLFITLGFVGVLFLGNRVLAYLRVNEFLNWKDFWGRELGFHVILNLIFLYPVYWYYELQLKIQHRFAPEK
jgi:rod shape-determining protein MreD